MRPCRGRRILIRERNCATAPPLTSPLLEYDLKLSHQNDRIFVRLEKGSFVTFRIFVSALPSNTHIFIGTFYSGPMGFSVFTANMYNMSQLLNGDKFLGLNKIYCRSHF